MNVTVNKTLQDRLVPGGLWKQLMHQCGKGQAQTPAKTYQRQSWSLLTEHSQLHTSDLPAEAKSMAEQLLSCCATAQVTNQHSAPPRAAPQLNQPGQSKPWGCSACLNPS